MSRTFRSFLVLLALAAMALPAASQDDDADLEDLLTQVGEQYARAYTAPLIHSWGANQNSALYHTAEIPESRLTVSFGIKVMGTNINEDDQTFRTVLEDVEVGDYFDGVSGTGDVVMEGPTIFGDTETAGTLTGYVGGLPVAQEEAIEGLIDTRWVPLFAPQLEVGGYFGVRGSLRWLPEIDLGDYGKTKYMGYGLSWSPNFLLKDLPVDVMVGFFNQQIDVGTIVETDASSLYLAASRKFSAFVVYGGFASESSTMDVSYTYEDDVVGEAEVSFETDGDMESRFTLGATLDTPVKLNAEMNVGTMVVYSAGLMFGF
ncbi:hypothetical protein GF314_08720 [bacterium]|nr:hypothetical protein [bacterium]